MARFLYRAKAGPEEVKEGVIEAETQRVAINKLSQMGYFPIEVKEEGAGPGGRAESMGGFFGRVRWRDLSIFTRELADLLGSGLTILNALSVLNQQLENKRLKAVVGRMHEFVKEGGNFSDALGKHPRIFSSLYVSMVRAGEVGGMLEPVLNRLADFTEAEDELRSKVRSALAYPLLMGIVGVGTIVILLTFVIPRLVGMFEDMGQALPLPTQMLVAISNFFVHYWWLIASGLIIMTFAVKRRGATREGKFFIDRFKLGLFGLGAIIKKTEIARLGRTLGTLLENGVPIIESLDVVAKTMENEVIRRELERATKEVTEGSAFSKSIRGSPHFPPFVTNMVAVGEEGGKLESSLLKVADAYERDVDRTVKTFTALLEPIIILIMGSIVGFIVISMLLPIFQINLMAR